MLEYNNILSVKEYCELRSAVDWPMMPEEQAQAGLNNFGRKRERTVL